MLLAYYSNKPKELPPPYPPPPPFLPLDSSKIEDQIGLLQLFYLQKLNSFTANMAPDLPAALAGLPQPIFMAPSLPLGITYTAPMPIFYHMGIPSSISSTKVIPAAQYPLTQSVHPPALILDDSPNPTHTKIGPLGQILKPTASQPKKKSKGKDGSANTSAPLPNNVIIRPLLTELADASLRGIPRGESTKKKRVNTVAKKEKRKSAEPI